MLTIIHCCDKLETDSVTHCTVMKFFNLCADFLENVGFLIRS